MQVLCMLAFWCLVYRLCVRVLTRDVVLASKSGQVEVSDEGSVDQSGQQLGLHSGVGGVEQSGTVLVTVRYMGQIDIE